MAHTDRMDSNNKNSYTAVTFLHYNNHTCPFRTLTFRN